MNKVVTMVLFGSMALVSAAPAMATGLTLGTLTNYGLVDLGSGTTIGQNSGPMTGNELLGNGVKANFAGGGNGSITGTLYYDSTVQNTNTFSQLQTAPTTQLVSTSVTNQALADAVALSNYAAGLTATQTYGNITNATTITGNGGLNVIAVNNISNALTITGGANDTFVFDVSGTYNTNQTMVLNGVSASQILFNFTATSGNVFQTSGGDTSYGTYLAVDGGNFQFSNLNLTGGLINTAGNVQFVSGTKLVANTPFSCASGSVACGTGGGGSQAPEPSSIAVFAIGIVGLVVLHRRRVMRVAAQNG